MKPKDLRPPFSFQERQALVKDGVFYISQRCQQSESLSWRWASIEFCSGNGDWIIERALSFPEKYFVAVEMRFDRVRKIWSKMHNCGVKNLLIVCGEARTFVKHHVPDKGVEDVFINFPDPWPKRRHAKHRLMQKSFLDELERILCGNLTFVTDDDTYLKETQALLDSHPSFEGEVALILPNYGSSYFERLWREKGKEIYYATYRRRVTQDREDLHRFRTALLHTEA